MPNVRQVTWPNGKKEFWIEPQAPPGVGGVVSYVQITQGEYEKLRTERRERLAAAAAPPKKPPKAPPKTDGD